MTPEALDAAAAALAALVPGGVTPGAPAEAVSVPLAGLELPAVLAEAPLEGPSPGTMALVLTVPGTRRLAAALGAIDEEEAEVGGGSLGERELAAVARALATVLAEVAGAADPSVLPGRPAARVLETDAEASTVLRDGHALAADVTLLGEPARLAFVVDDAVVEAPAPAGDEPSSTPLSAALRGVDVRVWAELGRTRMPTGEVVGLPSGAIVELDRDADDAVDLYVDGQRYASGRLVVTDDDSWGVLVERVDGLG